jgi:hypothetical protein
MSNVNLTLFFQIANLRSNAKKYIEELGSIDDSQLPPFIKSVRNLVQRYGNGHLEIRKTKIRGKFI